MTQRVVITGTAALVAGGASLDRLWQAARTDDALPAVVLDGSWIERAAGVEPAEARILARHQSLALAVVEAAWTRAGLPRDRNRLRGETGWKRRHPGWATVGGTSVGGLAAMELETGEARSATGGPRLSPYAISRWRGNSVTAAVALRFGLGGADFSVNAASATGAQALYLAATLVRSGVADLVVAVAVDPVLPPVLDRAIRRSGSVAPEGAGRPLSADRGGMRPVEGAGSVLVESGRHAEARGAVPLAEWVAGRVANETHHLMAPEASGAALREALARVVHDGGLVPEDIDWVSLHATGTRRFDPVETTAVREFFRPRLPWLSALKRSTGHALGASGLIEAALLVEGLRRGEVPAWPANLDASLGVPAAPPGPPPAPHHALLLSQGMGGSVAVNLIARVR